MRQFPPLLDSRVTSPTQNALALGMVTDLELLRLKTLARWYGRGLRPEVASEDLLQEALTRILVGRRPVPEGVPIVAFIAGVMRSVRSEHWQRIERTEISARRRAARRSTVPEHEIELVDAAPSPDRAVMAQQELAEVRKLFSDDAAALSILDGLELGLTADEICHTFELSETDYASARKRMRRVLLREGLTCAPN